MGLNPDFPMSCMIENYKVEIDSIADFYELQRFIKEKISELTLLIAILTLYIKNILNNFVCIFMVKNKLIYSAIIALLTICPLLTTGQIEVYRSYEHYMDTSNKELYKSIKLAAFKNNFIFMDLKGNKHKIPCDSIWGYTNEEKIFYKVKDYRGSSLKVETVNNRIVLYSDLRDDTYIFDHMIIPDKKLFVYFSKTLQDTIYPLEEHMLIEQYNLTDIEKLKLNQLRHKGRLKKKNSITGIFYIIEAIFN